MKIIVFAGGSGTRLWPLSRSNTPKQFLKLYNGKSTFELTIDRVKSAFGINNIYISTNKKYKNVIKNLVSAIKKENIILEPAKRDLAPAVGYSLMKLKRQGYLGPIAIIWADHLMENVKQFQSGLKVGEKMIEENPERFIFMGEKPRFPNHNIGWISIDKKIETKRKINIYEFKSWVYRPKLQLCKKIFKSKKALWNTGYFITSVKFVLDLYKKYKKKMYNDLETISKNPNLIDKVYPKLESISFDDAIVVRTKPKEALVLSLNLDWSDPGTLYGLKEALQNSKEANVTRGKTIIYKTKDSLIYNDEDKKLIAAIGLDGFVVVNTEDSLFVCHKDDIPDVKKLLKKFKSTEFEKYL